MRRRLDPTSSFYFSIFVYFIDVKFFSDLFALQFIADFFIFNFSYDSEFCFFYLG